jgi:hypothetical protein
MNRIAVAPTRDRFLKDGQPWFYLADTVWSAFTSPTRREWDEYLEARKRQGFNALQINVLPQWDRSGPGHGIPPFILKGRRWDFSRPNPAYFDPAERMLEAAVRRGFTPSLALLWCNYVPGTWAAKHKANPLMPLENVARYVVHASKRFARFSPLYMVSGDTNLDSPRALRHYRAALNALRAEDPKALVTLHTSPMQEYPRDLVRDIDFYLYQSGHAVDTALRFGWENAEKLAGMPVKKPIVNGEPCYEGHGWGHGNYGRYRDFDVRRAAWSSVLAGAKAGIAYGAHGVWSWHKPGLPFPGTAFSDTPYPWREALRFPGVKSYAFLRSFFEKPGMQDLEPAQGILRDPKPGIRAAAKRDGSLVVVYVPFNTEPRLALRTREYRMRWTLFPDRRTVRAETLTEGASIRVRMHEGLGDALLVGSPK